MNVYLAGTNGARRILTDEKHFRPAHSPSGWKKIFILESFYYLRDWMPPMISEHWEFMLDSGAFTFFGQKDKQMNWDEYLERYAAFINQYKVDLFFELDVDVILGLAKVEAIRKKLELLTSRQSIPVWRPSRGIEYWKKMCDEFSYVAISASGNYDSSWTRKKTAIPVLRQMIDIAHRRRAKVHGLGYTNLKAFNELPFDSVDSTTWLYGNMVGIVYQFDGKTIVKTRKPENARIKCRETMANNFAEWLKFQRYAEHHL